MTDREMLELAAKAAQLPCKGLVLPGARTDDWWGMYTGSDDDGAYLQWNPLTDDGDALRLVAALEITIRFVGDEVFAHSGTSRCVSQEFGSDRYAATRRAITRAAAEIGRAMK